MNKKICIISTVDMTLSQFVLPSAREMKRRGFEVTLVSSMSSAFREKFHDEFHLVDIQMERGVKLFGMIKGIISFYKLFKNNNFDIIQYATPNASFYASLAGTLAGVPKRLYCQWGIRYVGLEGISRKVFKTIEKITCYFSTDIRPASHKNMEFAISEKLYDRKKSKVVGHGGAVGIDLEIFNIEKKETYRVDMLIKYPKLKDKIVFGFIGRLDKDKGIRELFEAFQQLNNDDAYLFVIGPDENDGSIPDELFLNAKNNDKIIFSGFVTDVVRYLSVITILVHPSYREGFSAVIQQAMAMGVPIITTDIPGPSEVIEENISGLLVAAKNTQQLSLAMSQLSNDSKMQKEFAKNGLNRVKELFTQDKMTSLILEDRINIIENNRI